MKNFFGLTKHRTKSNSNSPKRKTNKNYLNHLIIAKLPLPILFLSAFLLVLPITRELAIWMLAENRPIELLTFVFLIIGGIRGVILAWQLKQRGEPKLIVIFYLLFSLGLLAIGAEEVAWGQWFVGFETPSGLSEINTQNELTFHNLEIFNDHLEIFPLLFGILGIVSVWLNKVPYLHKISSPSVLLSWYLVITFISAIDFVQDFWVIQEQFDYLINYLDEVIEMLVGMSGFLYIWLNAKAFKFN